MRDCYDTCSLLTEIRGGRIRVKANPKNRVTSTFLCPKGALLPKWVHSDDRISTPLLRIGDRPSEDFQRISWNVAISIIAKKMKEIIRDYGPKAILLYYYYGDRGLVNAQFPHRLFNYLNASIVEDVICDRSGEEALKDTYGTAQGMDPEELENENLLVFWGINSAWTNMHGFFLAKRLGLEIWSVDIVKNATSKKADRFFMLKPETDTLFALGVAKIIVEEKLYDERFLRENTLGFEELKKYVESLDMDYISNETGVDEEDIRYFAENYAEKRGVIHIGYGFQRTSQGGEAVRAISILPALVGRMRGFIYSNRILPRDYVRGDFLRESPGYKITHLELADYIEDGRIKFIFIYGTNPLATLPDQKRLRRVILEAQPFIVLHDLFLTDTALFSDVVLPANTFFERDDIADSYYHRYLAYNEKILEISGKSNSEVARLIAKELNLDNPYLYEEDEKVMRHVLEEIGISYDELKEKGVLKIPLDSYSPNTESEKIELYSRRAIRRGLNPFPTYEKIKGKGIKLISATYLFTISSQYHNTYGYEDTSIYLNPQDALERGIEDGTSVRVFNEYGEIRTFAKISEDVQKGVAIMYKAFWPKKIGWNVNFLTPPKGNEKYGNGTILHTVWVEVERV